MFQSQIPFIIPSNPYLGPSLLPNVPCDGLDINFTEITQVGPAGPPGPEGPIGPQGPPGSLADVPVTLISTSTYTPTLSEYFIGVVSTTPTTITLPVGTIGKVFVIKDSLGTSSINPITISTTGSNIDGNTGTIINNNWASITLIYDGSEWGIV